MTELEHGSYLVHRVAMCVQCHSARESGGELAPHRLLEGATMPLSSPFPYQAWASAAPPIIGLPTGYTEEDLVSLLSKGRTLRGRVPLHPMPPYRMTGRDARAVAAYLKWAGTQTDVKDISRSEAELAERAVATLKPSEGSKVSGVVEFARRDGVTHITATLSGLTPGLHGFHITAGGDCGDEFGGAHLNPEDKPHGSPQSDESHLGDLGNIVADENGHARYERIETRLAFDGENSVIGRAIVVRENPDDLSTQPDGGAGAPVACGTIRRL